jgi:type I restriction enzyme M protein
VPEDQFGQAYEYLIKRFADDSGHTAQEFYTNRTLVHLMTLILDPQPGESVYDPTCGTGGMLLSAAVELKRQRKEHRSLKLYGQELNVMSSSIARTNLFLHGIADFNIERGNTLSEPKFLDGDRLERFDVVLANPPYSIKQWDRKLWAADPYGRNVFGTPPQGRADYAFFQHILASMKPRTGRCAILLPHGVLFRDEEREMRRRIIEADLIDCVLGLGPGLFYNSPMEACVLFCRTDKPADRKGKVLFINAVNEVTRVRSASYLSAENIQRIAGAYATPQDENGLARMVSVEEILAADGSLALPLYVSDSDAAARRESVGEAFLAWQAGSEAARAAADRVLGLEVGR